MGFVVYIIFSQNHSKIYIGYTSDLVKRLLSHNVLATKGYTLRYRPWAVIYSEVFDVGHKFESCPREYSVSRF